MYMVNGNLALLISVDDIDCKQGSGSGLNGSMPCRRIQEMLFHPSVCLSFRLGRMPRLNGLQTGTQYKMWRDSKPQNLPLESTRMTRCVLNFCSK